MNFLSNYQEQAYALLRIVSGFLFIWHGTVKFFNYPMEFAHGPLTPLLMAAGTIEIVGGTLIMIGLFTRYAAFICSGTMAVAYWLVHGSKTFFPIVNHGELAALFCFCFLFIATKGAGIWSLDKK